ncbi:unnamed protein product [Rhizophagus irregularis]|nr:unnamed protein product [Rhizophagus irregularis]CAB5388501.1 unnamed protein product [Rhizophagus irregularis]
MSGTASTSKVNDIYQEIYRLKFPKEERSILCTFFINNLDKKDETEKAIIHFEDEVKIDILRNLLPPSVTERDITHFQKADFLSKLPFPQPAAAGIPGIKFQDKAIWVNYNEKRVFFSRANLEENEIFDVIEVIVEGNAGIPGIKFQDKAIWVNYNEKRVFFSRANLEENEIFDVIEVIVEGNEIGGLTAGFAGIKLQAAKIDKAIWRLLSKEMMMKALRKEKKV